LFFPIFPQIENRSCYFFKAKLNVIQKVTRFTDSTIAEILENTMKIPPGVGIDLKSENGTKHSLRLFVAKKESEMKHLVSPSQSIFQIPINHFQRFDS
jgi:hypothetical protein